MKNIVSIKIVLMLFVLFFLVSCTQRVEEERTSDILELNETKIQIDHNDRYVWKKGILSGYEYDSFYNFSYKIEVSPQDIVWKDKDEPKELLLCNQKVVFLFAIGEHVQYDTNETIRTIVERYSTFVDKRYFFNLLGDSYWSYVDKVEYDLKKKSCTVLSIPNQKHYVLK